LDLREKVAGGWRLEKTA